jgi:hypothetical protein
MQAEVRAKDEQILRWETVIMTKMDDLHTEMMILKEERAEKKKLAAEEAAKKQTTKSE